MGGRLAVDSLSTGLEDYGGEILIHSAHGKFLGLPPLPPAP